MTQVAKVNGYIRAVADQSHPLQTKLSLILTDFEPNGNRQGIPRSEKENILRTAQFMPLKINFNGSSYAGHTGAVPIGPITHVYETSEDGRDIIAGDAIIWNEVYNDVAEHLKVAFSEGVGTSWEIYFEDSVKDDNNVEWLSGCVFAGTCVVEVPSYGPNRTRILAIAEKLQDRADTLNELEKSMSGADMEQTRTELLEVQDILFKLWEGVDTLFNNTFKIEAAQVEKDIGKIAETFAEKLSKLSERIGKLMSETAEKDRVVAELTAAQAELTTLKQEKVEAEQRETLRVRTAQLKEAGIDESRYEIYVAMDEELFKTVVADFIAHNKKTTAEQKPAILPEPKGSNDSYSVEDIVNALKERSKKN